MRPRMLLVLLAAWLTLPREALATADFVIEAQGAGFSDATPAAPVGGNLERTVGSQRLAAVRYAAAIWGRLLDSPIPIVVRASFDDLGCGDDSRVTLAQTRPVGVYRVEPGEGASDPGWVPLALGNRIVGRDLEPDEPDILLQINTAIDAGCTGVGRRWYYGFDGAHESEPDLVDTLIHELAHGLGFSAFLEQGTGAMLPGGDAFTAHIVDTRTQQPWSELDDAERLRALSTPRSSVWRGEHVQALAAHVLRPGTPSVTFVPAIAAFSGWLGDGGIGAFLTRTGVQGPLVLLDDDSRCAAPPGVTGAVVMFEVDALRFCGPAELALQLQRAGAVGVLLVLPASEGEGPLSFSEPPRTALGIPLLTVASADAQRIARTLSQGGTQVRMFANTEQLSGADPQGRPFLYTNFPVRAGSNASHFESLARPDLLMEPASRQRATHEVDLTLAVLKDIGWVTTCGNGKLDAGEDCDEGAANGDSGDPSCRTTCRRAGCGDGVVSGSEECDDGEANSDSRPNVCRTRCLKAHCGDRVVDRGESCDGTPGCDETCGADDGEEPVTGKIPSWPVTTPREVTRRDDDGGCSLRVRGRARSLGSAWVATLVLCALVGRRRRRPTQSR